MIHFGQDGGRDHDGTLYLVHNTIVTPFISPVVDLSSAKARAVLRGNILDDGGRTRNNQVLGDGRRGGASAKAVTGVDNWIAPGFANRLENTGVQAARNSVSRRSREHYVAPARHDYRLREAWGDIVRAGRASGTLDLPATPGGQSEDRPLGWQYAHPAGKAARRTSHPPDLGAMGFDSAP